MANNHTIGFILTVILFSSLCNLDSISCQKQPRLDILPVQSVQRKPVGKSLMLTCRPDVPDSSLVSDLQWRDYLNMTVLPKPTGQSAPPMYTEVLPGDQSLALLIPSLTEGMAGMYYCSASYANTEQLEISVKIETYVAITWKNAPENQYPIAGTNYAVKCEVTANPAPTVDWLRNGDPIKSGGRYVVETRGLLIQNVEDSDDGIYTCRAAVIQTGELVERNIRVEVHMKPKIDPLPDRLEAVEEQQFSVMCNATGKPVPEFTWIKDQSQINVANADRFLVNAQTGQMSIIRVTKEDYGNYTCIAQNAAGHEEAKVLLDVLVKPRIYELINQTWAEDTENVLVCKASGRPAPEITFRRWGSTEELVVGMQPDDDRIYLEQTYNQDEGIATGTLRVLKFQRKDDGLYECVARNRGDTAYKVGHLTIQYKPNFDRMKKLYPVYTWEERRANLSCLAEGFPNATIQWLWNERRIDELYDPNLEIEGSGPRSNLLVKPRDRRYYTAYKCVATNILGRAEHMMELREARLPETVVQATPKIVTATTITFDIIQPPTELGLPITALSVQYKEQNTIDWKDAFSRDWSPESVYTVEGLRPQTPYEFRFAARNLVGLSQWGAYKSQSTPRRSAPEPPRILHTAVQNEEATDKNDLIVVSPYSDHFELGWSIPADNGEPINSYQVRYCPGNKVDGAWIEMNEMCVVREVSVSDTSGFKMTGLQGDSSYRIELKAHNAIGYSLPATLIMRTARGSDLVIRVDSPALSSAAIIGIAVGAVLLLLLLIDFVCCMTIRSGIMATLCRRTKRSPSELDDETKIGREEKEPLRTPEGSIMKHHSTVEFNGRVVHSRSGEIIGKNSSV